MLQSRGCTEHAEVLFDEMKQQRNFKPRIPQYNTMIQFYTHIVQNRERVLYYFSELMRANVQPTVHTYKVNIVAHYSFPSLDVLMKSYSATHQLLWHNRAH
jgi:hypothetical protein